MWSKLRLLVQMVRQPIASVLLLICVACSDSPAQPTATPTPTPVPVADLVVRLTTQVDGAGVRDAVAGFSEVTVDASASTGPVPLTFAIDFGDGARVTTAGGKHVYANAGTFTVTVEVRDSQGRASSRTQSIVVQRLVGSWYHAAYDPTTHRAEVRRLDIQSQDGPTIRGVYSRVGAVIEPFTATLSAPRRVQIVAGVTTLDGVIPNQWNTESEPWRFEVRGAGYSGEPFDFRAIIGEPTGPPPEASLVIRMGNLGGNVGIVGLTDIEFDGSGSRGEGLSYILDFGDGQFTTVPRANHRVDRVATTFPGYSGRMTAVDRFGRSNTESIPYAVWDLLIGFDQKWYYFSLTDSLSFNFSERSGAGYQGTISYRYPDGVTRRVPCTAMLSGDHDIVIVVESLGLEFRGYVDLSRAVYNPKGITSIVPPLIVTQQGGPDDGRTWTLKFDDGPG